MTYKKISNQAITGIIIISIGIILLIGSTGIYNTGELWKYLPSVLIIIGLWSLIRSSFRNTVGPIILILIGVTIQLLALEIITDKIIGKWWPLFLVIIGLLIILGRTSHKEKEEKIDEVDSVAIFSGRDHLITSKKFKGGNLTALFGGVNLDLRNSQIEDPPAEINVVAMFGGIDIKVPKEWNVKLDVFPVLGGSTDERSVYEDRKAEDKPEIIIKGFAAFGGLSVKD